MNYAIIGCGLIGKKRLAALPEGSRMVVACDLNLARAEALISLAGGGTATADYESAVSHPEVEAVVVATLNATLAAICAAAIRAGKHVIVEKPGGVSPAQIDELAALAAKNDVRVRVGFNHRFHPSFQKAAELIRTGELGDLMFIRARYGHGGRVGYDREWRADPQLSGGGELMDQGVHLIDLSSWFLGDFTSVEGHASTLYWDMPVDDNAFLSLRTAANQTAWLHVSCSEWKNLFSFEIYGRGAKVHIEGLGGSYGVERLYLYKMLPEMGPPDTTIWEYPRGDSSWKLEMSAFEDDIRLNREPEPGLHEARIALDVVTKIYAASGY
ncbi:MAG: Gfo/Idh/MocA family oxidoreductase [Verrucomicrobiaceae bacterium]|nr:MAG: Gfo/Idh/MocA family oxidoreductase [Verrucomicrobiaceae bacterium]